MDGLNLFQFVKGNPVNSVDVGGMGKNNKIKDPPQGEPRLPADPEKYEHDKGGGWRVNPNRGDTAKLLNSDENRLLQHISEGVNLALGKIKDKLGSELSNKVTLDRFKITEFDIVEYTGQDDKTRQAIFPVELKADINAGGRKIYSLNINVDNPSIAEMKQGAQRPHGPHIGAEITGNRKAGNEKNLHAHIPLKNIEGIPSRHHGKYKTVDSAVKKVRSMNYEEATLITKSNLFLLHNTGYALDDVQRLGFQAQNPKKESRMLLRAQFNLHNMKEFMRNTFIHMKFNILPNS